MREYTHPIFEFGQLVFSRLPSPEEANETLQAKWIPTVWFGRTEDSDENICGMQDGRIKTFRSCRNVLNSAKWDKDFLMSITGVPFHCNKLNGREVLRHETPGALSTVTDEPIGRRVQIDEIDDGTLLADIAPPSVDGPVGIPTPMSVPAPQTFEIHSDV
jgi:hypothetical protein